VKFNPDILAETLPELITWTLIPTNAATLVPFPDNTALLDSIDPDYLGLITVRAECYDHSDEFTIEIIPHSITVSGDPSFSTRICRGDPHPFGTSASINITTHLSPELLADPSYDHSNINWLLIASSSVGTLVPSLTDRRNAVFTYNATSDYVSSAEDDILITASYDDGPYAPPFTLTVYDIVSIFWETDINPIDNNVHPVLDNPAHPDYARARTWDNLYNPPPAGEEDQPPLWGGGKRIYPDKNNPTDTADDANLQRQVIITVVIHPSTISNIPITFKVFDIDDPTQSRHFFHPSNPSVNHFYNAKDIDGNDVYNVVNGRVLEEVGDDNQGAVSTYGFLPDLEKTITRSSLDNIVSERFVVSVYAGDNYRIGASCHDGITSVTSLEVPANNILEPKNLRTGAPLPGVYSPMLTVWRRLNVEYDCDGISAEFYLR
jgi:hypothetical protein